MDPNKCPVNTGSFYRKLGKTTLEFTDVSVRLMQGVRLIWGPLNTGFTVFNS